ncbi:MAG: hypothetical protein AB1756_08415 [Acidobacteriota bacterium]
MLQKIFPTLLLVLALTLLLSCSMHGSPVNPRERLSESSKTIAFFPFTNLSEERSAGEKIVPLVKKALEEKGFQIIDDSSVEEFLRNRRIRYTDSLTVADAMDLLENLGAKYIMTGTIFSYSNKAIPRIGLSVRLIDSLSCSVKWCAAFSMTGEDEPGFLNLSKAKTQDELVRRAVKDLFSSLTVRKEDHFLIFERRGAGGRNRILAPNPHFFRKRGSGARKYNCLAILPFSNLSNERNAARIVYEYFFVNLHAYSRVKIVDPAEVRRILIKGKVRNAYQLDRDALDLIRSELGVQGIIMGTVYAFEEGINGSSGSEPEVELSARLIDAVTGEVIWTARHRREGSDSISAYEMGRVRDIGTLTSDTVTSMILTLIK